MSVVHSLLTDTYISMSVVHSLLTDTYISMIHSESKKKMQFVVA